MSDEDYVDKHLKRLVEKGPDTLASLRAEVERLRGFETANRLNAAQVKAQRAEVERVNAENEKLRAALSGVLWMAEEWFNHGGDETTLADDYEKQLEAARAALEEKQ